MYSGMFDGLGRLLIAGAIAIGLLIFLGPWVGLLGLAWLLEPRLGHYVYAIANVIGCLWACVGLWFVVDILMERFRP